MSEVHEGMFDEGDERNVFSKLFILKKILGKGAFGTVVAAVQRSTQRQFAVKIVQKNLMDQLHYDCLLKEADILQQLNHKNIVKFERILESETRVFLVMELVHGGSLQDYIEQRNKDGNPIKDEEAASMMKSILAALHYIHSKDIIHRDLKPHNILIGDHNNLESIKICDFGLSAQYDSIFESSSFTARVGTRTFMAPELWLKKPYSKPVDIWSCGIILYMLLSSGKHPLYVEGDNETTYLAKLDKPEWKYNSLFNKYSKDLFTKLVNVDPIARYTVEQVQNHPWITRRFHEGIPLTSPEKMRAFSHSQILSRALKSMYVLYKLPGVKTDVDSQHQQRIAEISRKNETKPGSKNSPFVNSFRIHFETINTDNDLSITSLNNFNRDSNSPSPVLTYGAGSINFSPKQLSPTIATQQLGTIPESATREIQRDLEENADNEIIERSRTKNFFNDDSFTLPDAQNQMPESKQLQFTLAVVPIKNETSTEASQTNGMTPLQQAANIQLLDEEDPDDDDNRLLALRKARTMETEDREFRPKYKGTFSIGGGGSNVPSNMPSPTHKTTNSMAKSAKKPFFTNALDLDLSQRKDEKLSEFIKEQRKNFSPTSKINDSPKLQAKSNVAPYTPFKDAPSIEASFRSTIKNRSPLARKTQKIGDDTQQRNINNMKLPSITKTDSRTKIDASPSPSPKKTIVIDTKTLGQTGRGNRLSLSPLKTSKDWSPSKDGGKTKIFINEKSPLKEQLASLLSTQLSQAYIKK